MPPTACLLSVVLPGDGNLLGFLLSNAYHH